MLIRQANPAYVCCSEHPKWHFGVTGHHLCSHTWSAWSREQERIAKAEAARRETERILREQQAEVDAKKADMVKRDIQREKVSAPIREHALRQGMLL